ncbi:MAG TPA: cytidylate kinase-like family protein [Verrucomicrobiae bacterium]
MNATQNLSNCLSYVVSQGRVGDPRPVGSPAYISNPTITLSYQTGIDIQEIAGQLIHQLEPVGPQGNQPWQILDRELVAAALEQQHWPAQLAGRIEEAKRPVIEEWLDDVFGFQPPAWLFVPQMTKVIASLAHRGGVILIGHGASVVTAEMSNVLHVRVTGSPAKRAEYLQRSRQLPAAEAAHLIRQSDQQRADFLKAYFKSRLDNELLYDLTINTDRLARASVASLIAESARRFFRSGEAAHFSATN